jgi:hypothetical protein
VKRTSKNIDTYFPTSINTFDDYCYVDIQRFNNNQLRFSTIKLWYIVQELAYSHSYIASFLYIYIEREIT